MQAASRASPAEQSVDRQRGAPAGRGEGLRTPPTPCRPCYGPAPKASHSPCTPGEASTSTFRGWWGWAGGGGGGRGWARGVKPCQPCPNPIFPTARGSLPRPARTSEIGPFGAVVPFKHFQRLTDSLACRVPAVPVGTGTADGS